MQGDRYKAGELLVMLWDTRYVAEPGSPHFVEHIGSLDAGSTVLAVTDEFDFSLHTHRGRTSEPYIKVLTPEGKRVYLDPRRACSLTRDEAACKIRLQEHLHQ